ncbi:MAG TPA: nucleotide kinase domain-containing protein [Solirubrobacterales bacterium]|nr:nucleotide kinase domain-containing protein [Solirubrobacterales bacterium]
MDPVVRPEVHDTYWRFAARRHEIFLKRFERDPDPWGDDEILRRYKFCNTYRAADRVSQYMIQEVIYGGGAGDLAPEDIFLRIVLFRLFSKEATWDALEEATGGVRRETLDVEALGDMLEDLRTRGPIYTAAFILAAPSSYRHKAKHRNHLALVADMFRKGGFGAELGRAQSLDEVFAALTAYPGIGPFLGYQIAIDLNYSAELDFDENEFTVAGPGALRGIEKVFSDTAGQSPENLIMRMVERQEEEFARLGLKFDGLFDRPLKAIDCQGLFCETDKYSRVAFPQLKSNRVRIKQEFAPSNSRLELFFPPKWEINENVAAAESERREFPGFGIGLGDPEETAVQMQLDDSRLRVVSGAPGGGRDEAESSTLGTLRRVAS